MMILLVFLSILVVTANTANILGIFPLPFYSHSMFQESLVDVLLSQGHHVTIITEILFNKHENLTQIHLEESTILNENINPIYIKKSKFKFFEELVHLKDIVEMHSNQLKNTKVQELIRNGRKNQFDLIIIEPYYFHPMMAFAEIYDCPIVLTASLEPITKLHSLMGNDVNPITQPDMWETSYFSGEMTFLERIDSIFIMIEVYGIVFPILNAISRYQMRKYFPTALASQDEIEDRISLMIVNTNPAMGYIRPTTNTLQLGFLYIQPPKPLSNEKLVRFIEEANRDIIYISFGTIAKPNQLSDDEIEIFINVFAKLDFLVIWKFDNETLENKPANVFISNWLPQADLLAHPRMRLFITHGGMASLQEAIDRTVPLVLVPLYVDQNKNAKLMERKGVGVAINLNYLTEDLLWKAMNETLKPVYKENMIKLRKHVYDQPMTSRESAIFWFEFLLRHKGAHHLKNQGRKVPFYQKYCLDVFVCFVVVFGATFKLVAVIKKIVKKFKSDAKIKKD
jgi:glucuronosyltransferase